jgi:hypothetical protein
MQKDAVEILRISATSLAAALIPGAFEEALESLLKAAQLPLFQLERLMAGGFQSPYSAAALGA